MNIRPFVYTVVGLGCGLGVSVAVTGVVCRALRVVTQADLTDQLRYMSAETPPVSDALWAELERLEAEAHQ